MTDENGTPGGEPTADKKPAGAKRGLLDVSKGRLTFWIVALVVGFYLIGSGVIGLITGSGS